MSQQTTATATVEVPVSGLDALFGGDAEALTASDRARYSSELNGAFPHLAGLIAKPATAPAAA